MWANCSVLKFAFFPKKVYITMGSIVVLAAIITILKVVLQNVLFSPMDNNSTSIDQGEAPPVSEN